MEHGFTWTEQWRNECEARYLLAMPLEKRRSWLAELERVRGNIDALKQEIVKQWKHGKPQADKLRAEIKRQKRETT